MSFEPKRHCRFMQARALRAAAVASVGTLCLAAANAHADSTRVQVDQVVRYHDLDLSKKKDAAVLYSRLRAASSAVCGDYDARQLALKRLHAECRDKALSDAVARVDHSAVYALHSGSRIRVARGAADESQT